MAVGTLLEFAVTLVIAFLLYTLMLPGVHNTLMDAAYSNHVVSKYDDDWAYVLGVCIDGAVLAFFLGSAYYAYTQIVWKQGG